MSAARVAELCAGDAVVWVAYPKQSSKRHKSEFNRDTGWARFGELGFEPVRQAAIDEDSPTLRLRRGEHIQKMTRAFAMTAEGKQKASYGRKQGYWKSFLTLPKKPPASFSSPGEGRLSRRASKARR